MLARDKKVILHSGCSCRQHGTSAEYHEDEFHESAVSPTLPRPAGAVEAGLAGFSHPLASSATMASHAQANRRAIGSC